MLAMSKQKAVEIGVSALKRNASREKIDKKATVKFSYLGKPQIIC